MNKTAKWIIGVLCFVLVITGAYLLYNKLSGEYSGGNTIAEENAAQNEDKETAPQKAPDFTVTDKDGKQVKLSDYYGRPIVLNFWASWCPPCKAEMPDFNKAYKENPEIQFLMVNATGGRETLDSAKKFIKESGYEFPVFFDSEYNAVSAYGASSLPMTFFIDKNGNLTAHGRGMLTAEALNRGIEMISGKKAR